MAKLEDMQALFSEANVHIEIVNYVSATDATSVGAELKVPALDDKGVPFKLVFIWASESNEMKSIRVDR